MTTEEHAKLGPKLRAMNREILHALVLVCNKFPKSHPAVKALVHADAELREARSQLDKEYSYVTPSAEFVKLGHVYHG